MRLSDLAGRRVALLGLGVDVLAALPLVAAERPAEIVVVDDHASRAFPEHPRVELAEACRRAEVIIRSPGFPRLAVIEHLGVPPGASPSQMTTPTDLWMASREPGQTVIGVTGTKGKSSTTLMIGELARAHGVRLGVAGNMGVPIFSTDWDHDAPFVALEISSYQASDLSVVPAVAVLTSLAPDHVDWHGGYDAYVRDKLRVVSNGGRTAATILVPEAEEAASRAVASFAPTIVVDRLRGSDVPAKKAQNASLAASALESIGVERVDLDVLRRAASSSLPGRLDPCPGPQGATWIDDTLASNPTAAAAALAWARSSGRETVILIGGADRGLSAAPLAEEVARWGAHPPLAVTLGAVGARFAAESGMTVLEAAPSVEAAVDVAVRCVPAGGLVLFSPGAPTPQGEGGWQARSTSFRHALDRLARGGPT